MRLSSVRFFLRTLTVVSEVSPVLVGAAPGPQERPTFKAPDDIKSTVAGLSKFAIHREFQRGQQPAPENSKTSPLAVQPTPTVIRGEGWAIAAPDDWSRFPAVRPPMQLFLIGDHRKGIPPLDGTLAALQAGLTVEVFPAREGLTPRKRAEKDLDDLKGTAGFEIIAEPEMKEIELADGTNALVLKVEVAKARDSGGYHSTNRCTAPCRTDSTSSPPAF